MKVYMVNDYDWYMAESLEQAATLAMEMTGLSREEATHNPHEVPEEKLHTLMFHNEDGSKWSFARELQGRIEAGMKPGFFASTEY